MIDIQDLPRPGDAKIERLERAHALFKKRIHLHQLQQLFWECTLRCNLGCLHCGSDCRAIPEISDMPLEDFLLVLDDISSVMNPKRILVITTGGEPLVRKDICRCGIAIRERGFHWGMVSNGWLLDKRMCGLLQDAGLETIAISLDGFRDAHDWLRGREGSFTKAVTAISNLVNTSLKWDVITCVNQNNVSSLSKFKNFLIDLGVKRWRIFSIAPIGRAANNPALYLDNRYFRELMEFIVSVRKEGKIKLNYSCEGFLGDYEYEVRDNPFFCQSGINVASILADGSISGCLSIRSDYHQGNIYRDSFTNVWSDQFLNYRRRDWMQKGQCVDCDMWKYCHGNGMHLRDNDGNLLLCNYKK